MFKIILGIYRDAGGFKFVFGTAYLYVAIILSVILIDRNFQVDWPTMALGIFPSLIGFFLATFAIVLALFGSENLAKLATKRDGQRVSPLAKLTALIVHASLVQVLALITAFSLKQDGICSQKWGLCGWQSVVHTICEKVRFWEFFYQFGFFLTLYGLVLIVSTLLAVFQTSQLTR